MLNHAQRRYIEPTRIKAARYARGLSVPVVAQDLNISPSYYRGIECGLKDATPMAARLATVFRKPEPYFFADPLDMPPVEDFTYRKQQSMRKGDQEMLRGQSTITVNDLRPVFDKHLGEYEVNVPDLQSLSPEEAAMTLRETFNLGHAPLRHALDLAETMGVFVHWHDGPKEFEAVSYWHGNRPVMVLNSKRKDPKKRDGYRFRFSILHEIAHFCLHKSGSVRDSLDKEADRFASTMLMPASTFARWCPKRFDPYQMLDNRRIWGASIGAMVRRARDLDIFSDYQYRDARISLSRLGWATGEPNPADPEKSSLHRAFFEAAGDEGLTPFHLGDESLMDPLDFLEACPQAAEYERGSRISDLFEGAY